MSKKALGARSFARRLLEQRQSQRFLFDTMNTPFIKQMVQGTLNKEIFKTNLYLHISVELLEHIARDGGAYFEVGGGLKTSAGGASW